MLALDQCVRCHSAKQICDPAQLSAISVEERKLLGDVAARFPFSANDYYLSLIDWDDPQDPIRRLIVPQPEELEEFGRLDASNEASVSVGRGIQHKYTNTVLLLCSDVCAGYCRYCFRKRLFMGGNGEVMTDLAEGIEYISSHPEVTNVLLTGGDPLLLGWQRLGEIIGALRAIPHVKIIRIGSKLPAFNPHRILNDPALCAMLQRYSEPRRRLYLMAHFDHPRELTDAAVGALDMFIRAGVICVNQCPLLCGVNDDPQVLSDLYRQLSFIGCPPYYLLQCRPALGNKPYAVPLVRGWDIFRQAITRGSGLARRPRFVMSHATGKIEIMGVDERHIYLRFQCAKDPHDQGRMMLCERDDEACWFDQLRPSHSTPGDFDVGALLNAGV